MTKPEMPRLFKTAVFAAALAAAAGCSQALPNQDLRAVGEQTRIVASTYAVETRQNAEAAEQKLARAEQLLREARELYSRAEAAEKRCAERAAKLQKVKPVIITKCAEPAPTPQVIPETAGSSSSSAATPAAGSSQSGSSAAGSGDPHPTPSPAPSKNDPEYSPSDAPL